MAGLDQSREIGFSRMSRHAAHRDRLTGALAAPRQRNIETGRGDFRILEEEFEKVAHPVKQESVARLFLETPILGHHRCWSVGSSHKGTVAAGASPIAPGFALRV